MLSSNEKEQNLKQTDRNLFDILKTAEAQNEEILKMIPAGRMGDPDEVAHAVAFLMDEKAAYITRQVIAVNGGLC